MTITYINQASLDGKSCFKLIGYSINELLCVQVLPPRNPACTRCTQVYQLCPRKFNWARVNVLILQVEVVTYLDP